LVLLDDQPRRLGHLLEELVKRRVKDMVEAACAAWQDDKSLAENLCAGLRAILDVEKTGPKEEILAYEMTVYASGPGHRQ